MIKFSSKISVKLQARVVIFVVQVDNDELYCQIANESSDAYSSLCVFQFSYFPYFE